MDWSKNTMIAPFKVGECLVFAKNEKDIERLKNADNGNRKIILKIVDEYNEDNIKLVKIPKNVWDFLNWLSYDYDLPFNFEEFDFEDIKEF